MVYQELEQQLHIVLLLDDKVDVPSLELKSETLPTVEGQFLELFLAHTVDLLPEHPETTRETTKDDALDLVKLTSGVRGLFGVFVVFYANITFERVHGSRVLAR